MGLQHDPTGIHALCLSTFNEIPAKFRTPLKVNEITPEAVTERLSWRLRQLVGPGRRWSVDEVSAATGIDCRTLRLYIDGHTCPSLARYYMLLQCLGKETGIELAIMLGWIPRHMASSVLPATALSDLREGITRALSALETVIPSLATGLNRSRADIPTDLVLTRVDSRARTPKLPRLSAEAVRQCFSIHMRKLVGAGRRWSYNDIMRMTEIDHRTLKAYVLGTSTPNLANYKRLLAVLGPEIANNLSSSLGWLPRVDRIPPESVNFLELQQILLRTSSSLERMGKNVILAHAAS